jgi:hypothetical protein
VHDTAGREIDDCLMEFVLNGVSWETFVSRLTYSVPDVIVDEGLPRDCW